MQYLNLSLKFFARPDEQLYLVYNLRRFLISAQNTAIMINKTI